MKSDHLTNSFLPLVAKLADGGITAYLRILTHIPAWLDFKKVWQKNLKLFIQTTFASD